MSSLYNRTFLFRLKNEGSLRKHLKRHEDTNGEIFKCTICDKVAKHKDALVGHMRSVHCEKRHICTLCDKAFKCAKNLKVSPILIDISFLPLTFNLIFRSTKRVTPAKICTIVSTVTKNSNQARTFTPTERGCTLLNTFAMCLKEFH